MQHYAMHGLIVASDIPVRAAHADPTPSPDVTIRIGETPDQLPASAQQGAFYAVTPRQLLLRMPRIATYHVQDGRTITIAPAPDADPDSIELLLLGSPFAALLQQRGLLTLHGAAIETPHGAALLLGQSSSGKSTIAAALWQRGYRLLSDDIAAITPTTCAVIPQTPYLRLWPRTLRHIGHPADKLERVRPELEKRWLPLDAGFCPRNLSLHVIYLILPPHRDTASIQPLKGLEKVALLKRNTYRRAFYEQTDRNVWYLRQCTQLAQQVQIARLQRPRRRFDLDSVVSALEEHWAE